VWQLFDVAEADRPAPDRSRRHAINGTCSADRQPQARQGDDGCGQVPAVEDAGLRDLPRDIRTPVLARSMRVRVDQPVPDVTSAGGTGVGVSRAPSRYVRAAAVKWVRANVPDQGIRCAPEIGVGYEGILRSVRQIRLMCAREHE